MTAAQAREALEAVIREQLREAWERGLEVAPHSPNALADTGAPGAFRITLSAAFAYADALAETRVNHMTAAELQGRAALAEASAEQNWGGRPCGS